MEIDAPTTQIEKMDSKIKIFVDNDYEKFINSICKVGDFELTDCELDQFYGVVSMLVAKPEEYSSWQAYNNFICLVYDKTNNPELAIKIENSIIELLEKGMQTINVEDLPFNYCLELPRARRLAFEVTVGELANASAKIPPKVFNVICILRANINRILADLGMYEKRRTPDLNTLKAGYNRFLLEQGIDPSIIRWCGAGVILGLMIAGSVAWYYHGPNSSVEVTKSTVSKSEPSNP